MFNGDQGTVRWRGSRRGGGRGWRLHGRLGWSMCAATAPSTSLLFTPLPQVVSISPSERKMVVSYPHLPEGEQEKTYQVGAWQ